MQGYLTTVRNTVRIPAWLAPEWNVPERRQGDDLLIDGQLVTDPQVLAELSLPDGEAAVVVLPADVPALEAVLC